MHRGDLQGWQLEMKTTRSDFWFLAPSMAKLEIFCLCLCLCLCLLIPVPVQSSHPWWSRRFLSFCFSVNLNLLLCTWHQLLACSHWSQRLAVSSHTTSTVIFAWKTIYAVPGEDVVWRDSPCELLLAFEPKSQNADQALPASFYVGRCQLAARPRRVRNTF